MNKFAHFYFFSWFDPCLWHGESLEESLKIRLGIPSNEGTRSLIKTGHFFCGYIGSKLFCMFFSLVIDSNPFHREIFVFEDVITFSVVFFL